MFINLVCLMHLELADTRRNISMASFSIFNLKNGLLQYVYHEFQLILYKYTILNKLQTRKGSKRNKYSDTQLKALKYIFRNSIAKPTGYKNITKQVCNNCSTFSN